MNAIGNLELTGPYAEALSKLGYELENVASQVRLFDKICFQLTCSFGGKEYMNIFKMFVMFDRMKAFVSS